MAKLLAGTTLDRMHAALQGIYPLHHVKLDELHPYYRGGDYGGFLFQGENIHDFENELTASLLILAAEEELDDYPMEAVE